jgi:hypothetical protein
MEIGKNLTYKESTATREKKSAPAGIAGIYDMDILCTGRILPAALNASSFWESDIYNIFAGFSLEDINYDLGLDHFPRGSV